MSIAEIVSIRAKAAKDLNVSRERRSGRQSGTSVHSATCSSIVRFVNCCLLSTSKATQKRLKENMLEFWPLDFWPLSSPHSFELGVWGVVERKAWATCNASLVSLKATVEQEWTDMSKDFICKTCAAVRPRIEAMIATSRAHFQK